MSIMDKTKDSTKELDPRLILDSDSMSEEELKDALKSIISSGASVTPIPGVEVDEEDGVVAKSFSSKSLMPVPDDDDEMPKEAPIKVSPAEVFKETFEEGKALGIFNKDDLPYYKKEILREMKTRPKTDAILSVVSRMKRKIKGASKLPSSPGSAPVKKFEYYLLTVVSASDPDTTTASLLKVASSSRLIDNKELLKYYCVSELGVGGGSITAISNPHPDMYDIFIAGNQEYGITMVKLTNFPSTFKYDGRNFDCFTIHTTL